MSTRSSPRLKAKRQHQEQLEQEDAAENASKSTLAGVARFGIIQIVCYSTLIGLAYGAGSSEDQFESLRWLSLMSIGIQMVVFILHAGGLIFGNDPTERFYDLTGAITNCSMVALSAGSNWGALSTRQQIVSCLVAIWAIRLGAFLFSRIELEGGIDSRFIAIKKSTLRFCTAWSVQGVWVFFTTLPLLALNTSAKDTSPLGTCDYVGIGVWAVGFIIEVIADAQKTAFRADSRNSKKFIQSGLWAYSRHPNYFGEIILWKGVFMTTVGGGLMKWQTLPSFTTIYNALLSSSQFRCCVASPIFVYLLLNYVSGINLLEKSCDAKWGNKKEYMDYKATTPVLVPFIGKRG